MTIIEDLIEVEQAVTLEQRRAYLRLPLEERRQLAEQAEKLLKHYKAQDREYSASMPYDAC